MSDSQHDSLPPWWFEVDEVDDIDTNTSLLQELDIDLPQIYRSTLWMLLGPLGCLCRRHAGKHPLSAMLPSPTKTTSITAHASMNSIRTTTTAPSATGTGGRSSSGDVTNQSDQIDFWGPCSVVSFYGALLWLDRVRDVGWLFIIWTFAAFFNHFVSRVFCKQSRLMIHYSLLGYSVTPLIPLSGVIILFHPPVWACTVFEIIAVIWASLAAFQSYLIVFNANIELKKRLILILPSVVLMELYLISLLPIRPPRFD